MMDVKVTESQPVETEEEKKFIALKVPEALRQKIRKDAFERDITFSAMVRLILEEYYSNNITEE